MGNSFGECKRKVGIAMLLIFVGIVAVGKFAAWRQSANYLYGWSHCSIKQFSFALELYALRYDGHFPAGREFPEASLSLLHYQEVGLDANLLRGKTVPEDVVQAILDKEELLAPESCGWHYVEGLTQNDDMRLAILWDKAGLGHNGERNAHEREVLFVGGAPGRIPHAEWPKFLAEQEMLLANRNESAVKEGSFLVGKIQMPNGELLDHYEGRYRLPLTASSRGTTSSGDESGENFRLKLYGKHFRGDGVMTWTLELSDLRLRSKPVTITVENDRPSQSLIIFEMEETK